MPTRGERPGTSENPTQAPDTPRQAPSPTTLQLMRKYAMAKAADEVNRAEALEREGAETVRAPLTRRGVGDVTPSNVNDGDPRLLRIKEDGPETVRGA